MNTSNISNYVHQAFFNGFHKKDILRFLVAAASVTAVLSSLCQLELRRIKDHENKDKKSIDLVVQDSFRIKPLDRLDTARAQPVSPDGTTVINLPSNNYNRYNTIETEYGRFSMTDSTKLFKLVTY